MRWPVKFTVVVIALILVACRIQDGQDTESELLDTQSAASLCAGETALSSGTMAGKAVFDVSSRCVFNREVHDVRIRILSETLTKVLADGCADRDSGYGHVIEAEIDGHRVPHVGIKVRGNTSRCNEKRQFALKFDEEEMYSVWQGRLDTVKIPENDGRRFFGLEALNLRASSNDPSMARERIASRLFTQAEDIHRTVTRGGMVYRVAFSRLFVSFNRKSAEGAEGNFRHLHRGYWYDYRGFYSLAESIDKTFVESRLQEGTENLGFHLIQADVGKMHFHPDRYSREGFKAKYFKGKKVKDEDAEKVDQVIAELIALLNSSSSDANLEAVVDIDNIINYYVSAMLAGHWDSMVGNRNNDYLLFNPKLKKWQIITWDLDNSLGVIRDLYKQYIQDDIYAIGAKQKVELFTEIFRQSRPQFRSRMRGRLRQMLGSAYSQPSFDSMVDQLRSQIQPAVDGWEGVQANYFEDIKRFAASRRNKITSQL